MKRSQGDFELYKEQLEKHLSQLSIENLVKWQLIFDEYLEVSNTERLWAAAYLLNDGVSEDMDALDEESLAEFEEIMYVAGYVYAEKIGDDDDKRFFVACEEFALTEVEKQEILRNIRLPDDSDWDEEDNLMPIFPNITAFKGY
ncbi:DUF4240 domain-containing protein [Listeria sp. W9-0585]|uniref:DUF4240 domain-containing protein n=2 Tax=Listeria rustica TaxID=2713503 RepID=A0A7W1T5W2_9LIST|nr:DUF4240 domain-containing protein [Listeria rustica]